ncbi:MAG: helix-turn-helix transcriptional regulator [Cyanothece sp. SIO2G6]|nr:helix-turn-helix transcriptional regulator [Cyanothece sp. SIO2G6]
MDSPKVSMCLGCYDSEEHSIKHLSERFSINECKLKRGFKALYKQTIFGYLRECRMICAEGLLRQSEMPVLEIAMAVGFENPSYFSRLFKERFGLLPKAYRSMHSKPNPGQISRSRT